VHITVPVKITDKGQLAPSAVHLVIGNSSSAHGLNIPLLNNANTELTIHNGARWSWRWIARS